VSQTRMHPASLLAPDTAFRARRSGFGSMGSESMAWFREKQGCGFPSRVTRLPSLPQCSYRVVCHARATWIPSRKMNRCIVLQFTCHNSCASSLGVLLLSTDSLSAPDVRLRLVGRRGSSGGRGLGLLPSHYSSLSLYKGT
jgi:hypothetical protein